VILYAGFTSIILHIISIKLSFLSWIDNYECMILLTDLCNFYCFYNSFYKSLSGTPNKPDLRIDGLDETVALALIHTGIIVKISKRVIPKDQMSGEDLCFQMSTSYFIVSCLMISGARYSGVTNQSFSPFKTPYFLV